VQEVFENLLTKLRVLDLWVPLHAIDLALRVGKGSHRRDVGRSQNFKTLRSLHHLVAVAHPANLVLRLVPQDASGGTHLELGRAVFLNA
jgi:hypothetical protein